MITAKSACSNHALNSSSVIEANIANITMYLTTINNDKKIAIPDKTIPIIALVLSTDCNPLTPLIIAIIARTIPTICATNGTQQQTIETDAAIIPNTKEF